MTAFGDESDTDHASRIVAFALQVFLAGRAEPSAAHALGPPAAAVPVARRVGRGRMGRWSHFNRKGAPARCSTTCRKSAFLVLESHSRSSRPLALALSLSSEARLARSFMHRASVCEVVQCICRRSGSAATRAAWSLASSGKHRHANARPPPTHTNPARFARAKAGSPSHALARARGHTPAGLSRAATCRPGFRAWPHAGRAFARRLSARAWPLCSRSLTCTRPNVRMEPKWPDAFRPLEALLPSARFRPQQTDSTQPMDRQQSAQPAATAANPGDGLVRVSCNE
jgi:hypothetical protein